MIFDMKPGTKRRNRYHHDEYKESRSADQFSFTTHGQEGEREEEWFLKKGGTQLYGTHPVCPTGKVGPSDFSCHNCAASAWGEMPLYEKVWLGFQMRQTCGSNEGEMGVHSLISMCHHLRQQKSESLTFPYEAFLPFMIMRQDCSRKYPRVKLFPFMSGHSLSERITPAHTPPLPGCVYEEKMGLRD